MPRYAFDSLSVGYLISGNKKQAARTSNDITFNTFNNTQIKPPLPIPISYSERLSGYLGLGVLLSASDEAMMLINNTKFSDNMKVALVCYATNVYPELPKLGKSLE
ncbi:hypothetical protein IFR05_005889 [Cadophora sp. M221]|nr:hypothetical protein IFR05_005889 [Cadophora sp. M221]